MVSDRSVVASILLILTCLLLGLLTGAMLVIGVSLVSFWKSLSPSDFQVWFATHSHLIGRLMIPLGIGGLAVSVAAVIAGWRSSVRGWLLIAAVSAMGVMVTYPLFFATTNETFVRGGLADAAARSLLDHWAAWHWLRTGFGAVGFVAALRALHG
jgi:Anthrone oxygenase